MLVAGPMDIHQLRFYRLFRHDGDWDSHDTFLNLQTIEKTAGRGGKRPHVHKMFVEPSS